MILTYPKNLFFTIVCLASLNTAKAQMEPIETDRPDQIESVSIVPKKWLQFEAVLIFRKIIIITMNFYCQPYKQNMD